MIHVQWQVFDCTTAPSPVDSRAQTFTKNFQEAGVFVQIVFESADSRHIFVVEGHHQNVQYPLNRQNCANARYTQITTQWRNY